MLVTPLATLIAIAVPTTAAEQRKMHEIHTSSATPAAEGRLAPQVPFAVQRFDLSYDQLGTLSVAEFLERRGASFTLNDAQNNPLQPDLQFRGFTASPLLGTPQGIAVFQNGVRLNENFGQAINWDLLPDSIVERITVIGGSNPLYGLNSLGGALVIETRDGFSSPGIRASARYGSFDRREFELSGGYSFGNWGFYLALDHFAEDGWRDFSDSEASNVYGALSWRGENTEIDLYLNGGDSELRGNGASPIALLEQDRDAVFTHPDLTENRMGMVSLAARHQVSDRLSLDLRAYFSDSKTDSFNGDGAEAESCDPPNGDLLCAEDGPPLIDQFGNLVMAGFDAVNNRSQRDQLSWGGSLEAGYRTRIADLDHHFVVGLDYGYGRTRFESAVEFAALRADRSTTVTGIFDGDGYTSLRSETRTFGIFAADSIKLTRALTLSLSARYNESRIDNADRSGERPALDANHKYKRLNGGAGLTYEIRPGIAAYGGFHQSSRAPTPVELSCSHEDEPCRLPNTFLADPPLDDVVSRGLELGLRGAFGPIESWRVGVFRITNHDDIIFQTTGGVSANEGFFSNVGKTRRQGVEFASNGGWGNGRWFLNYSYLDATFRDAFFVSSPSHPLAVDDIITVVPGSRLPGLPTHQASAGLGYLITQRLEISFDVMARSGQYFRGDEGNLLDKTRGYAVVGAHARFRVMDGISFTLDVHNLFDKNYETFGAFGEADEVLGDMVGDETRFLGPGAPRGIWAGLKLHW